MENNNHLHYEGQILVEDGKEFMQGYLQFPFSVPSGIDTIKIYFFYTPLKVGGITNVITVGIFDPNGFRGNAHRTPPDLEIILSAEHATPGFISGPIREGEWLVQLAAHAVLAGAEDCSYSLDIDLSSSGNSNSIEKTWVVDQKAVNKTARWYKGELHSHTCHSDGELSVKELVTNAKLKGLDFLAITDHNTTSSLLEIQVINLDGILIIPGLELTSFHGHALLLGIQHWIDWRIGWNNLDINNVATQIRNMNGVFIMAHPNDVPSPRCTGCRWEFTDINWDLVDAYEVWNGPWRGWEDANLKNLNQWQQLQKNPRHIPVTSGADFHNLGDWKTGVALTYIYAEQLSIPALFDGIRKGKMILSNGPWVTMSLCKPGGEIFVGIGETLITNNPKTTLSLDWESIPKDSRLVIRSNQGEVQRSAIEGRGAESFFIDTLDCDRIWVEIFSQDGSLLLISNPIFITYNENRVRKGIQR
jgi:hypothetical protein